LGGRVAKHAFVVFYARPGLQVVYWLYFEWKGLTFAALNYKIVSFYLWQ